ncbi:hypothetical protein E2C01_096074 [Portunus trituberculatus]|uniref:Uncharacterized protein n=1 Tax=Portunus trituberculatus TaxID=210409 RepID=A0A5B7JRQ5_PORTR|nr:hypothetical protein [Portunus trituberculatus]
MPRRPLMLPCSPLPAHATLSPRLPSLPPSRLLYGTILPEAVRRLEAKRLHAILLSPLPACRAHSPRNVLVKHNAIKSPRKVQGGEARRGGAGRRWED